MSGRYIALEGPEGAGKSTIRTLLAARLATDGAEVVESARVFSCCWVVKQDIAGNGVTQLDVECDDRRRWVRRDDARCRAGGG